MRGNRLIRFFFGAGFPEEGFHSLLRILPETHRTEYVLCTQTQTQTVGSELA